MAIWNKAVEKTIRDCADERRGASFIPDYSIDAHPEDRAALERALRRQPYSFERSEFEERMAGEGSDPSNA